jgi:hypothetical protein
LTLQIYRLFSATLSAAKLLTLIVDKVKSVIRAGIQVYFRRLTLGIFKEFLVPRLYHVLRIDGVKVDPGKQCFILSGI